jgi:signal transduction histidine kinase
MKGKIPQLCTEFPIIAAPLLQMELKDKKNMAEHFIYSCSHSIRSPLKSMEGVLLLMKHVQQTQSDEWRTYLTMLGDSASRIKGILTHFQQLRLDSATPVANDRIRFHRLIPSILKSFDLTFKEAGIRNTIQIHQKGEMYGDTSRIRAILSLLITNAIAFRKMDCENRKICVFITASEASCSIQVHDNGIGIPEQEQSRIFDIFYRASNQSTGPGMGLFIARKMVQRICGTIGVQSTENEGSVFSVWIPNLKCKTRKSEQVNA